MPVNWFIMKRVTKRVLPVLFISGLLLAGVLAYAFFLLGQTEAPSRPSVSSAAAGADKAAAAVAAMTPEERVGQLMMIGIMGPELDTAAAQQLARCPAGNIIFFDRNMVSPVQVRKLTKELRQRIEMHSGVLPFIALDQEGGRVLRMRGSFPAIPSEEDIGRTGDPAAARKWAVLTGKTLHDLGINVNLAPVVDLGSPAERSYSTDPGVVTEFAAQACQGYRDSQVWCALKHFPGIGKVKTDPHIDGDRVQADAEELRQQDIKPFADLIRRKEAANAFVMVSNVTFPALDPEWPACVSQRIMTDILRGTCGYQGLILSDDMEMGAMAKHYAFSDMGVMAIKAGADIVLVCHDYGHEKETFEGMLQAYKTDPEFQRLADEKVMRIVRTKLR